jgi:hypothetical protein
MHNQPPYLQLPDEWKTSNDKADIRIVDVTESPDWVPVTSNFKHKPLVELDDNGRDFTLGRKLNFWYYRYCVFLNSDTKEDCTEKLQSINTRNIENMVFLERPPRKSFYRILYVHITIKEGFETDFVSSPRLLWWLISPLGKAAKPSVLHDLFYRVPLVFNIGDTGKYSLSITQKEADWIFYLSLKLKDMGKLGWLMYKGLRIFGKYNFLKS